MKKAKKAAPYEVSGRMHSIEGESQKEESNFKKTHLMEEQILSQD